jgi:hypothetical protein
VVGLLKGKLEGEVHGESAFVPFHLLVQPSRLHPVEGSKIGIENCPATAQDEDGAFDVVNKDDVLVGIPRHAQPVGRQGQQLPPPAEEGAVFLPHGPSRDHR